ncbi:Hypothetical predicted protein [Podarcis lilfordi]|uniref:Uncharacterized protein n=1 Tax=Podarcis lilfordi TaxID=74358 RepID=A0AA35PM85_9SAUR|nr:Hypothetical predicted protein [Podarcis lilfordi]
MRPHPSERPDARTDSGQAKGCSARVNGGELGVPFFLAPSRNCSHSSGFHPGLVGQRVPGILRRKRPRGKELGKTEGAPVWVNMLRRRPAPTQQLRILSLRILRRLTAPDARPLPPCQRLVLSKASAPKRHPRNRRGCSSRLGPPPTGAATPAPHRFGFICPNPRPHRILSFWMRQTRVRSHLSYRSSPKRARPRGSLGFAAAAAARPSLPPPTGAASPAPPPSRAHPEWGARRDGEARRATQRRGRVDG